MEVVFLVLVAVVVVVLVISIVVVVVVVAVECSYYPVVVFIHSFKVKKTI